MKFFKIFLILFSLLSTLQTQAAALPDNEQAFINTMVKEHGFDAKALTQVFEQVQYQDSIIKSMTTPYEAQPWYLYREHFLTEQRINAGVEYWKKNEKYLRLAQERYGVDPAIIVGIIGVETNYGNLVGHYRVIDALFTLAFHYPPRSAFFTQELKEYLLMCRQQHISPLSIKGSYAGAFGIPQFMPSSSRRYAAAFDPKQGIDISNRHEDAIMSVANYFKANHWELGQPSATPAKVHGSHYSALVQSKIQLNEPLSRLEQQGVSPLSKENPKLKASLISVQGKNAPEYWVVFHNFKVIMSYNPRIPYAMAVYQLSDAVKQRLNQTNGKS